MFYAWNEPILVFVVLASSRLDWLLGRYLVKFAPGHRSRKLLVSYGVASNVGLLAYV